MDRHPAGKARSDAYEVRPGDSLWSIAASRTETDAETARCTRAIHRRNERTVDDPDLIFPGEMLVIPKDC